MKQARPLCVLERRCHGGIVSAPKREMAAADLVAVLAIMRPVERCVSVRVIGPAAVAVYRVMRGFGVLDCVVADPLDLD